MLRPSDLVRDSKLDTKIFGRDTRHTSYQSIAGSQQRNIRVEERWKRNKKIGDGTYGQVYLESCFAGPRAGELRAVKKIPKIQANKTTDYTKELEAITKFSQAKASSRPTEGPHLMLVHALIYRQYVHCFVQSSGWYEDERSVYIAMEYMKHGDLQRRLTQRYPEIEAQSIASQLLEGLQFMHENGFTHRDLKPSNILVLNPSPEWWVKIGDFGISKRVTDDMSMRTMIGTRGYIAPEVLGFYPHKSGRPKRAEQGSYTSAVDIWALGAICFKLIVNQAAFPEQFDLIEYAVHGLEFPNARLHDCNASHICIGFINSTMSALAADRPSAQKALMHAWVNTEAQKGSNVQSPLNERPVHRMSLTDSQTLEATAEWSTLSDSIAMKPVSLISKLQNTDPLIPGYYRKEEAETRVIPLVHLAPTKFENKSRKFGQITSPSKAVENASGSVEIHESKGKASNELAVESKRSFRQRLLTIGHPESLLSIAESSLPSSSLTLSRRPDNDLVDPSLFPDISINNPERLREVLDAIEQLVIPESETFGEGSDQEEKRLKDRTSVVSLIPFSKGHFLAKSKEKTSGVQSTNDRHREAWERRFGFQ